MDQSTYNNIFTIIFLVIIGVFALVSILTAYVFVRYGQKKPFTIVVSMAFGAVFFLGALTAFITLQKLF